MISRRVSASDDLEGLEKFTLISVGIDIGSSTSHLIFSRLTLRREAGLSGRFLVTDRKVLYQSPILLTPYTSQYLLDAERLEAFIKQSYAAARMRPDQIDTGAVILTGEALKKENARAISELFTLQAGRFICASAGPNHEAVLAAHGSGAVQASARDGSTVLNVDIGGGTTKFCVIRRGEIVEIASVNMGARLIALDEAGRIQRLEDAAVTIGNESGLALALGQQLDEGELDRLSETMVGVLFDVIEDAGQLPALAASLLITEPLSTRLGEVDAVFFSGGVSEYIYERDATSYGDLGGRLGAGIRRRLHELKAEGLVRTPLAGIRATVIGAGEYTVQASGTTSYISSAAPLPATGLKVLRARHAGDLAGQIERGLAQVDLERYGPGLAISLQAPPELNYASIRRLAEAVYGVALKDAAQSPVFLLLDADVAKSLGRMLKEELRLPQEVIALDGIEIEGDLDYVDIGKPLGQSEVVPVTVKSLVFPTATEAKPVGGR